MSGWFKRLLETSEERRLRQLDELSKTKEFKDMLRKEAIDVIAEGKAQEKTRIEREKKEHAKKVADAKTNIEIISNEMRDSKEPFVNVLSMGFTPENGIEVKLDYNDAFIRYLNSVGIKGANEDDTIRLWLAHLNYDIDQEALAADYLANGVSSDVMPPMGYDEMFKDDDEDENNQ